MDFTNGQARILLGSGTAGIRLQDKNGHGWIYQDNDLLTIIEKAAGDLTRIGGYIA